jgi:uncharacterized membrane protein YoaK (UPF0700 family)
MCREGVGCGKPIVDRSAGVDMPRPSATDAMLLLFTATTGLVDAVGVLALGHVFIANMTGNVVFVGLAIAGAEDHHPLRSGAAVLAFTAGAVAGGRLARAVAEQRRGLWLLADAAAESALLAAAAAVAAVAGDPLGWTASVAIIVLSATAMGLRASTVRWLGVTDLPTVVVTMTLSALAANSAAAGGDGDRRFVRAGAFAALLAGAAAGALLVRQAGPALAFVTAALLVLVAAAAAVAGGRR